MSTLDEMSVHSNEFAIGESASASGPPAVPAVEVESSAVSASDKPEADSSEQLVGSALSGATSLLVGASLQQCLTPTPRRRVLPVSPPVSSDVAAAPSPSPASVEEPAAAAALEPDQSPPADAPITEVSAVADADADADVAAPAQTADADVAAPVQTADEITQRADAQQTHETTAALAPEPPVPSSHTDLLPIRAALLGAYRGMCSCSNVLTVGCRFLSIKFFEHLYISQILVIH